MSLQQAAAAAAVDHCEAAAPAPEPVAAALHWPGGMQLLLETAGPLLGLDHTLPAPAAPLATAWCPAAGAYMAPRALGAAHVVVSPPAPKVAQ